MIKILNWDYTGQSQNLINDLFKKDEIEIVGTITPAEVNPANLLAKDYDYLLIFEQGLRTLFTTAIQALKIPDNKVIYPLDLSSWLRHPSAIFFTYKSKREGD